MKIAKFRSKKLSTILAKGFTVAASITTVCVANLSNVQAQYEPPGAYILSQNKIVYLYDGGELVVYSGSQKPLDLVQYNNAVYTAFSGGGIYRSPDGRNLGGGGNTERIYKGQKVQAMEACRGGIYTAFSGGGIYYSPNGRNLAGGGITDKVYRGTQLVTEMQCEPGTGIYGGDSVVTTFSGGGIYRSRDGYNLGGGGSTIRLN